MKKDIGQLLEELVESKSFVIKRKSNSDIYYIPYMMNDAVECFIKLQGCKFSDNWTKEAIAFMDVVSSDTEMNEDWTIKSDYVNVKFVMQATDSKKAIFLTEENGDIRSIWFEDYEIVCEFYQYHRLGHFWREHDESLRRLVYLIGTIYDKYKYLGEDSCNEKEQKLMLLLGVKPLRYFSPIDDSFDVFYDADELKKLEKEGMNIFIEYIDNMLKESYDGLITDFKKLLLKYNKLVNANENLLNKLSRQRLEGVIQKNLLKDGRFLIINGLEKVLIEASKNYKERIYKDDSDIKYNNMRIKCDETMKKKGFKGNYPYYFLGDDKEVTAIAYEEQPFVIHELEYEKVVFSIKVLVRNVNTNEEYVIKID